jgi:hypothetical protein
MTGTNRKRGGQPGNNNALKHGFYSNTFRHGEILDLDAYIDEGLDSEIALLRVVTRRLLQLANDIEDLDDMIKITGTVGICATRLASLLKTRKILGGGEDTDITAALSQALNDVIKELKLT